MKKAGQIPLEITRVKRGRPCFNVTASTASTASIATEESESDNEEIISLIGPKQYNVRDPLNDIRFDNIGHLPEHSEKKMRCRLCGSSIRTKCTKCNVHLCLTKTKNCYRDYHVQ